MSTLNKFILTIDGPAAAGKDTLAENLAKSDIFKPTSVFVLNTGDLYRAVTWHAVTQSILPDNIEFASFTLRAMQSLDYFSINRTDLFTPAIDKVVADVSAVPATQDAFCDKIRQIVQEALEPVVIVLGRNGGTQVFPQIDNKIYLDASPEECAHRRALDRSQKNKEDYEATRLALLDRNKKDRLNWGEMFLPAKDAFYVLTDPPMTSEKVYEKIVDEKIKPAFKSWSLTR